MAEEPTLPSLPKVSWDSHSQTFVNTRKRNRDGATPQPLSFNSSDPAVFSSDDDPHVDNYTNGRHRKKRYFGTWFQQMPASSDSIFGEAPGPRPKPNRTLERQLDSGVWMGSDESVDQDEDDEFTMDMEQPLKSKLPQLQNRYAIPSIAPEELMVVRDKIEAAIEDGNPIVELTSLGVTTLPDEEISRLAELTLIPSVDKDVPFQQTNPKLGLFLSSNRLTRAPGALFNLEHLTYLSLRNNEISELPPSIGQLRNLQELNLSLNRLRYLPGELLSLLGFPSILSSLRIHPNPFYRPEAFPTFVLETVDEFQGQWIPDLAAQKSVFKGDDGRLVSIDDRSPEQVQHHFTAGTGVSAWYLSLVARSPVQYSDSRGSVLSKFHLPSVYEDSLSPSEESEEKQQLILQTENVALHSTPDLSGRVSDVPSKPSNVFSLFELALKSASRAAQTWDLTPYLDSQVPSNVRRGIDRIAAQSASNGNSGTVPCSICGRRIITPVTQWIEWWDIWKLVYRHELWGNVLEPLSKDVNENVVPFLKRGCSWNCVPEPTHVGQYAPGSLVARVYQRPRQR